MANEAAQWVTLIVVIVLLLGIYRQLSLMLPASARVIQRDGPRVGSAAPARLLHQLERASGDGARHNGNGGRPSVVAFVTEACSACGALLADLTAGRSQTNGLPVVVVVSEPSAQFASAINESGLAAITDDGSIWDDCKVGATPLLVRIGADGTVLSKEVTHRVEAVAMAES